MATRLINDIVSSNNFNNTIYLAQRSRYSNSDERKKVWWLTCHQDVLSPHLQRYMG